MEKLWDEFDAAPSRTSPLSAFSMKYLPLRQPNLDAISSASRTPFVFTSVPKASSRLFVGVPAKAKCKSE